MFRTIISAILRSTRLCLQLVVQCTDYAACWWQGWGGTREFHHVYTFDATITIFFYVLMFAYVLVIITWVWNCRRVGLRRNFGNCSVYLVKECRKNFGGWPWLVFHLELGKERVCSGEMVRKSCSQKLELVEIWSVADRRRKRFSLTSTTTLHRQNSFTV